MNTIKSHGEQAEEAEDDGEDTDRDPTGVLAASALPPLPPLPPAHQLPRQVREGDGARRSRGGGSAGGRACEVKD